MCFVWWECCWSLTVWTSKHVTRTTGIRVCITVSLLVVGDRKLTWSRLHKEWGVLGYKTGKAGVALASGTAGFRSANKVVKDLYFYSSVFLSLLFPGLSLLLLCVSFIPSGQGQALSKWWSWWRRWLSIIITKLLLRARHHSAHNVWR